MLGLDGFLAEVKEIRALLAHLLDQLCAVRREEEKQTALLKIVAEQNEQKEDGE